MKKVKAQFAENHCYTASVLTEFVFSEQVAAADTTIIPLAFFYCIFPLTATAI